MTSLDSSWTFWTYCCRSGFPRILIMCIHIYMKFIIDFLCMCVNMFRLHGYLQYFSFDLCKPIITTSLTHAISLIKKKKKKKKMTSEGLCCQWVNVLRLSKTTVDLWRCLLKDWSRSALSLHHVRHFDYASLAVIQESYGLIKLVRITGHNLYV